jgi:serine/threonine-protein kinase
MVLTAADATRDAELESLVGELVAAGRHAQAAAACVAAGALLRASELLEEACDFAGAAGHALAAGELGRAARLAAFAGDDGIYQLAAEALADATRRDAAVRAAADLGMRGLSRHAADIYARIGAHADAAREYALAGEAVRASGEHELAGRPAEGARVLEAALRARPDDGPARLALGKLLAKHGRTEAAVKALQALAAATPDRDRGLPLLARCLAELGLEDAARSVREEMRARGVADVAAEVAPPSEPAGGALLFGRYRMTREVVTTPHARIAEAIDAISGERVAVKIFASTSESAGRDALVRFEREARALAQLRHPNAVPLLAYLPDGPAMVIPWMPGGSLADMMRREPAAPARAVEIVCAVLDALGEAHRLGILHRDVKPSNVLFDAVGTARLGDFGAAHLGDLSSTATAGAIGTFAYMSPEQRLGKPATVASDLYGAGAMLYELLTGEPAEPARNGRLHPPPSECHPDLGPEHDAAAARLLAEDPGARPPDAFEARRGLRALRWSTRVPERSAQSTRPRTDRPPPPTDDQRLAAPLAAHDGRDAAWRRHDLWTGRDVLVIAGTPENLARARAFARAGHAALPTVLRVEGPGGDIWVAPPLGRALADEPRALSPGHVGRLDEALRALRDAGGAHGAIDAEHLYFHDGEFTLAFPREAPDGVEEAEARDRQALTRLASG